MKIKIAMLVILFLACGFVVNNARADDMATPTIDFMNPPPEPQLPPMDGLAIEKPIVVILPKKQDPKIPTVSFKGEPLNETRIDISIKDQRCRVIQNGEIKYEFKVSTGRHKGTTPRGLTRVYNHALNPVSRAYGCRLYRWMAVTPNGSVGMHGLFMKGYEAKLGRPASHGCIRLSRPNAEVVYGWVTNYLKEYGEYPQVYIY